MIKKIVSLLVAVVLLLSGVTAIAAQTPAEEAAAYRALINAGFDQPDFVVRHFDSIAALTKDELTAIHGYFTAIDDAVKVAVDNVDLNLAWSQYVEIFANLNAVAKICKVSFQVLAPMPVMVKEEKGIADGKETVDNIKFVMTPVSVSDIINNGLIDTIYLNYLNFRNLHDKGIKEQRYGSLYLAIILEEFFNEEYLPLFPIDIAVFCKENGPCVEPNGLLTTIHTNLGITCVTGRDSEFAAVSGMRSLFADIEDAVAAIAAYKPAN